MQHGDLLSCKSRLYYTQGPEEQDARVHSAARKACRRRQDSQLQSQATNLASAANSKRTAPQWQPPVCVTKQAFSMASTEGQAKAVGVFVCEKLPSVYQTPLRGLCTSGLCSAAL